MKKNTYAVLYDGYAAWRLQQTATGAAAKAEKGKSSPQCITELYRRYPDGGRIIQLDGKGIQL